MKKTLMTLETVWLKRSRLMKEKESMKQTWSQKQLQIMRVHSTL